MLSFRSVVLCAGVCLSASAIWSQEYDLKIKQDSQGDVSKLEIVNSFQMDVTVDVAGKTQKLSELKSTETMTFVETVLAMKPGQKADELRREYETARIDDGAGKKTTLAFQGKKLLIQRKETGYEFRFEGGDEVEGESLDYLKNEFQASDDLAEPDRLLRPKKPVKVGETWALEMAAIAKNYARTTPVPLDQAKARGQGKLLKVYQKDGRSCAVIEVEIEIPLKLGPQGAMTVAEGSKLSLHQTIDGSIDGKNGSQTFESKMSLDILGQLDLGNGKKAASTMKGRGTFRAQQTDLSK